MKLKNYWFSLKSYVYIEFKIKKILLYDTKSGYSIETTSNDVIKLVSQLYEPANLGVVMVCHELENHNPPLWAFIQEIIEKNMGDITSVELLPKKPVRLVPILNLQKDVDKHKNNINNVTFLGKNISRYILEVNIYVNNICNNKCKHCQSYSKQMHCCTSSKEGNLELSIDNLQTIFGQLRYMSVGTINILGGNIFQYNHLKNLQELSSYLPNDILHFYIHYTNYQRHEFIDSNQLDLIISFPLDKNIFHTVWSSINIKNTKVHFIIENEQQYNEAENLTNHYHIERFDFTPFFTGKNIAFFDKNIFIYKNDLFSTTLSMREIFRNQKLNANFFGGLYILPDGTIKANMNTSSLGNINTDEILNIAYKELIENTAWRTIRNSKPCSECVYQFICPPPSDYERIIRKNNLCHINP